MNKKQIILSSTNTYDIIIEEISSDMNDKFTKEKENGNFKDNDDLVFHIENKIPIIEDEISTIKIEVERLPCPISHILAIGNTNDISETQLAKFIPSKDNKGNNFMCYSKKDFSSTPTVILHESATSSFYCIMELLKKPKYCIIYRRSKKVFTETEQILESNVTN